VCGRGEEVFEIAVRPASARLGWPEVSPQTGEMVASRPIAMVSAKNPNKKIAIFAIKAS
jgi:hypothetical protein